MTAEKIKKPRKPSRPKKPVEPETEVTVSDSHSLGDLFRSLPKSGTLAALREVLVTKLNELEASGFSTFISSQYYTYNVPQVSLLKKETTSKDPDLLLAEQETYEIRLVHYKRRRIEYREKMKVYTDALRKWTEAHIEKANQEMAAELEAD